MHHWAVPGPVQRSGSWPQGQGRDPGVKVATLRSRSGPKDQARDPGFKVAQGRDLKVKCDEGQRIIFLIAIKTSLSCAKARLKVRVMAPRPLINVATDPGVKVMTLRSSSWPRKSKSTSWDEGQGIIFLIEIKAPLSCARARSKVRVMTPRSRSRPWCQGCDLEVKVTTFRSNVKAKE